MKSAATQAYGHGHQNPRDILERKISSTHTVGISKMHGRFCRELPGKCWLWQCVLMAADTMMKKSRDGSWNSIAVKRWKYKTESQANCSSNGGTRAYTLLIQELVWTWHGSEHHRQRGQDQYHTHNAISTSCPQRISVEIPQERWQHVVATALAHFAMVSFLARCKGGDASAVG